MTVHNLFRVEWGLRLGERAVRDGDEEDVDLEREREDLETELERERESEPEKERECEREGDREDETERDAGDRRPRVGGFAMVVVVGLGFSRKAKLEPWINPNAGEGNWKGLWARKWFDICFISSYW